jgi:hypothetical protein
VVDALLGDGAGRRSRAYRYRRITLI